MAYLRVAVTHTDGVGNLNSPLATVYEQGSFVAALTELAFTAELSRAQPSIVTQLRKAEKGAQLDAGALFFDQESRNVANDQEGEESQQAARNLEMQARLCEVMYAALSTQTLRLYHAHVCYAHTATNSKRAVTQAVRSRQTPGAGRRLRHPRCRPSSSRCPRCALLSTLLVHAKRTHACATQTQDHELAPHVQVPQPRADLEALIRLGAQSPYGDGRVSVLTHNVVRARQASTRSPRAWACRALCCSKGDSYAAPTACSHFTSG